MDTSEQYIEMCRKAIELQEMWEPQIGDWIYQISALPDKITSVYKYSLVKEDMKIWDWIREDWYTMQECVWLPRIDQLATLYDSDWSRFCNMCEFIDTHNIVSFEQAGLMAVMERQYKKEWNGEDWI